MKLLKKVTRSYAIATAAALLAGLIVFYLVLLWMVRLESDEKLENSVTGISHQISNGGALPWFPPFIETSESSLKHEMKVLGDTAVFDSVEKEAEPYRVINVVKKINGRFYTITVRSSEIENGEFITSAFIILAVVYTVFMFGLLFIIRRQSNRLWKPFFRHLAAIRSFSLSRLQPVNLDKTGTDEFDEMKNVIEQLTRRAVDDYLNLKQFTENASHELQTPLALMKGKVETLLNDQNLSGEQSEKVRSIGQSLNRLERVNRSLLLLARIENRQFPETSDLNFARLIEEQVEQMSELAALKNVRIAFPEQGDFRINMNRELAGILVANLLSNAIRYTPEGGKIEFFTFHGGLKIMNTGSTELQKKERLFQRFVKEDDSVSTPGLGLSIVNAICELNGLIAEYRWDKDRSMHVFTVVTS
ncbi:MAG TPA: HAMP domain-containing sensor histidine kinase [Bacteroidales bacterium]|nr:HAMP domain-containing sensor histidine kinase [Bacteroidales bacterium]